MIASVRLARTTFAIDRPFDYSVPPKLAGRVHLGAKVRVPFGIQFREGYVVGIRRRSATRLLKNVLAVLTPPLFDQEALDFSDWISQRYVCLFPRALQTLLPPPGGAWVRNSFPKSHGKFSISTFFKPLRRDRLAFYRERLLASQERGGTDLLLFPEINDLAHFVKSFGPAAVFPGVVYHSGLPLKERRAIWQGVGEGRMRAVVGTRSALFLPYPTLTEIVIEDPSHEAYRPEQHPRYIVREVAEWLARRHGASITLGGAIPSIEIFYEMQRKKIQSALEGKSMRPRIDVVDLRHESGARERRLLSRPLLQEVRQVVAKGGRVLLVAPRRGFYTLAECGECGEIFQCPKCSSSLSYFAAEKNLRCPTCNFHSALLACRKCSGSSIHYRGAGVERIERWLGDELPGVPPGSMVLGTPSILHSFADQRIDLIAFLSADFVFHFPDYRAMEKLMQIIASASNAGKIILQTYLPEHPLLRALARWDLPGLFQEELKLRRRHSYPPFTHLFQIRVEGESEERARGVAEKFCDHLRRSPGGLFRTILGPSPARLPKRRGRYRFQIMVKGRNVPRMAQALRQLLGLFSGRSGVNASVELDPLRAE